MTPLDFLSRLRGLNVHVWVEDDHVRFRAPRGVVTPALREELAAHKEELVALLVAGPQGSSPTGPEPIPRVARAGPLPLSFAQERLWFLEQLAPGTAGYVIANAIPLQFPVEPTTLEDSLNVLVARHESFRTTFGTRDGRPVQQILPEMRLALRVHDLRTLPVEERTAEAQRLVAENAGLPFVLEHPPLLRAGLVQLGPEESVLLLAMHHIVADGWSMGIFFRELAAVYTALAVGREPSLPELRIQYADFAVWQRSWLSGEVLHEQVGYWREQLAELPVLQLPTDCRRPDLQTFVGNAEPVIVPGGLTARLSALSRQENCTLFMTLLAAFDVLLARCSGQQDIVVGTYSAGRNRADTEDLIGFFVNTLVLRTDVRPETSFRDLVRHVRDVALGAFAHQDLPFPKLVEELQPQRDLSRNPLFQVVFHLFNAPTFADSRATSASGYGVAAHNAAFDLVVNLMEGPDGLFGQVEYNTDLFDAGTVRTLVAGYLTLLEEIVADPDRRVDDLPMQSPVERDRMLALGRGPEIPLDAPSGRSGADRPAPGAGPPSESLIELFLARAAATPDAPALLADGCAMTYGDLDRRSAQLAERLRLLGVGPESVVGVCLPRSVPLAVALISVLRAGGAYLPLDPGHPRGRLRYVLSDAGAAAVVTDDRRRTLISDPAVPVVDVTPLSDPPPGPLAGSGEPPPVSLSTLAYVLYTSGSTGTPKGVAVEHRQVLNRLHWMWRDHPFAPDEVACWKTSVGFVDSLWELLGSLLHGVPTVVVPEDVARDPYALVTCLADHGVTRLWLVPSLLRTLLDTHPDIAARAPALRFWVTSGEELPIELALRFLDVLPDAALYNLYGTSEVWDATWTRVAEATPGRRVPIGRPIDNVQTYVLDSRMNPTPPGMTGELYVGGVGLARGYLSSPELNRQRFLPDPFGAGPGARLYRTGDLARWRSDGQLEYLGRRDHQVQVRGVRVELGEIETTLRAHPAVADAAVLYGGEPGREQLTAFVEPDPAVLQEDGSRTQQTTVDDWETVWDETYRQDPGPVAGLDTAAFLSSYTGAPIPEDEVAEWVANAERQVRERSPCRVLEIGCGTGMLLFRLASDCERYVGTDLSAVAVRTVSDELLRLGPEYAHVDVYRRAADDLGDVAVGTFDAVIVHSVVQYFPDADYLEQVVAAAVAATAPGGVVLLGDVRDLRLLQAFHTSVERSRAPARLAMPELRERIARRLRYEKELLVDPLFFTSLPVREPRISRVELRPEHGRHLNEFTRFRYDVVLGIDSDPCPAGPVRRYRWSDVGSLADLERLLDDGSPELVVVDDVPNNRVVDELAAVDLLHSPGGPQDVAELNRAAAAGDGCGIDPDDLGRLGERWDVDVRWQAGGPVGSLRLLIADRQCGRDVRETFVGEVRDGRSARKGYTNRPMRATGLPDMASTLRDFLVERLPEQVVPSAFVPVEALPLTSSGKLDRVSLAALSAGGAPRGSAFVAPSSPVEEVMAQIWAEVLGVEQVGVADDFFAGLGGHSLLAAQVVSRVRETLGVTMPLSLLFESPTIAGLLARFPEEPAARERLSRVAELLLATVRLSDEEVEHELAARRTAGGAGRAVRGPATEATV